MNTRTDVINYYINKRNYQSYLEIGVLDGVSFNKINIENKIGVDPYPKCNFPEIIKTTSDKFFEEISDDLKFDIIFIDGDHTYEQVIKDIYNSIKHLNDNGIIIMHDTICNYEHETCQLPPPMNKCYPYNGTVYQAFIQMLMLNELDHKYNIYYTGIDYVSVIDTQFDISVTKEDNILDKYLDIIKFYNNLHNINIDYTSKENISLLLSTYIISFNEYIKNKSWLYPIANLN